MEGGWARSNPFLQPRSQMATIRCSLKTWIYFGEQTNRRLPARLRWDKKRVRRPRALNWPTLQLIYIYVYTNIGSLDFHFTRLGYLNASAAKRRDAYDDDIPAVHRGATISIRLFPRAYNLVNNKAKWRTESGVCIFMLILWRLGWNNSLGALLCCVYVGLVYAKGKGACSDFQLKMKEETFIENKQTTLT